MSQRDAMFAAARSRASGDMLVVLVLADLIEEQGVNADELRRLAGVCLESTSLMKKMIVEAAIDETLNELEQGV